MSPSTPARAAFAPQLCLSMIVKNEAPVIARCLASVRPYIGAWAIVDTGSTDGTQALVRELMADLPGELVERPWVDFATNRNQALDLARAHGEYALIIDADEILERMPEVALPTQRLEGPGYFVRQVLDGSQFEYASAKVLRHELGWRWHGVLHEYPAAPSDPRILDLPGLRVRSYPDGARSQRPLQEKYRDDAEVLRKALATEPDNTRYAFYFAQSLRDAGDHAGALEAYRKRATMAGFVEEVWYAKFQVATLLERLQAPAVEVIDAYLAAFDARPVRAEPLCELARFLRNQGRFGSAYAQARVASEMPVPEDLLFLDLSVYTWRAIDERAVAAFYVGRRDECAELSRRLLAWPGLPAADRPRIEGNLAFCAQPPAR